MKISKLNATTIQQVLCDVYQDSLVLALKLLDDPTALDAVELESKAD